MAYVALYRRWRPQGFAELVGQDAVRRTLEQAVRTGRVAHAYLFAGPRGTGKTSTAKILARLLNCEQPVDGQPCGKCESCRGIADGTSLDVYEIDAASNRGIDEIRQLRDTVKFAPTGGAYKIYIIDEVHMLTTEAFNALLKTLEEPPERVVFILATTEAHKVPATIQSRCQRYDFKRIRRPVIEQRLTEVAAASAIDIEPAAISLIAKAADGGMRDALSLLDQCVTLSAGEAVTEKSVSDALGLVGREYIRRAVRALANGDATELLDVVAELSAGGKDLKQFVAGLITELRQLMIFQAVGEGGAEADEDDGDFRQNWAGKFAPGSFLPRIQRLHELLNELKWSDEARLAVETGLLAALNIDGDPVAAGSPSISAAAPADNGRIDQLEKQLAQLRAQLAALSSAPPPVETAPAPTAAKPTAKPLPRPKKSAGENAPAADDTLNGALPVTPAGEALWQRVVEQLNAEGNNSVLACIKTAHFDGMNDSVLRLRFGSEFLRKRADKADYRAHFEELISAQAGRPIALLTVSDGGGRKRPAPKAAPPPKPAIDLSAYDEQGQHTIKAAIAAFGNNITPVEPGAPNETSGAKEPKPAANAAGKNSPSDDAPLPEAPPLDDDFPGDDDYVAAENS